jgi:toxin ParE1/3/4
VALMRLVLTERFRDEIQHEYEFVCSENPDAARKVIERIVKSCLRLREFPRSGRVGRLNGAWELVVPGLRYIVAYDISDDRVELLMLFHTSRHVQHVH